MAKSFEVQNSRGMTDVLNRLDVIASENVLRQAAVAGARVIHEEVKLKAPVGDATYERKGGTHLPGTLKNSIVIFYDKENSVSGKIASYGITWSKDGFYGRFLEYGTSKMTAKPFLRPSYEAKRQAAANAVTEVIERKVREAANG
jgi:HK97 gp10 family phage protein